MPNPINASLTVKFTDLVKVFGEPRKVYKRRGADGKTAYDWNGKLGNGEFTIYDYKETSLYWPPEEKAPTPKQLREQNNDRWQLQVTDISVIVALRRLLVEQDIEYVLTLRQ
jgi:hypothetical protein